MIEVDFISNAQAEKDLKVSENIRAVALAIKNNLLRLLGLEANKSEILYRVCIGAYREKNNAIKQVELAKERGFRGTYIM